jgi:hypothetical protein
MSQAPRDAVIYAYVKVLKMPAIGRESPGLARQARDGGWMQPAHIAFVLGVTYSCEYA